VFVIDSTAIKELESIKRAILNAVSVKEIYLFGSYADGTSHTGSDFDLYVVIPDNDMRPIEAMQIISDSIGKMNIRAVDIIVGRESVFHQRRQLPTIERRIYRDGVKLYGQKQHSEIMA